MRFETPSTPKKEEHYSLDDPWYERFRDVASFQDYEFLDGESGYRKEQKNSFLSGKIENPSLGYPRLEKTDLKKRERMLLDLKKTIVENETDELLRKLYRWRLNEKIAEIRMLQAAKSGDDQRVLKYSKFIYGEPSRDIYEYTISQLKSVIDKKLLDGSSAISQAARRLNVELFNALANNETSINPQEFNLPKIKSTKEDQLYTAEEIKQAFEEALKKYAIGGWKVAIDLEGSSSNISTSQEKKTVFIPSARKIKATHLESLMEHEIGTHVLRREKGERSKLKLLGLGLDRYLKGEEGVATYREQYIEGAKNFSGLEGHLAISLALGMDGKKRNFKEVFEIMRDYYFITSSKKNRSETWQEAQNSAWDRCVRVFRGTTCGTPGSCLTRDITYREGNIGIWNVVKNNPEEKRRFSMGKYDPGNPRHIWILEQLGINEADLAQLEQSS